ncbi:WD40 repeat-like-containing domain protein [Ophiocordyceps sinensis CO18]|nr:WD40 repeat-like-containing domain protein [Ophiocordyceps sinensis CO18]
MDTQSTVTSKTSLTLDMPPSCMQFCPSDPTCFLVGTYNLHQQDDQNALVGAPQGRDGSLIVFRIDDDQLIKVQTVLQPSALLDLRFHPQQRDHPGVLAVVSSTGTLAIFCLGPTLDPTAPLRHLATSRCEDLADDVLFLQCDWHPVLRDLIAVTTSTGLARLLHLDEEWKIRGFTDLDIRNSLEAWSIVWSPSTAALGGNEEYFSVYCGGDDSLLRYTSCSSNLEIPYRPVTVKGHHDAGVTAILPLSLQAADDGRLVVTGSYDDHLRVFAIRDLDQSQGTRRMRLVCEKKLGGGVWRLGLVDARLRGDGLWRVRILASCMHAGTRLVELASETDGLRWSCTIVARFEEHKSMNYASDCVATSDGRGLRCVSASFYDKLLCLWEHRG